MGVQSMLPPAEAESPAKSAAQQAVECDPLSAEAHTSLAASHLFFDWNWPAFERAIRTSLQLNTNGEAHGLFAHYALARGWCDQAIVAQRRALDLDPMSATMNTDLIWAYLLSHDYKKALELGRSTERMTFDYPLTHMYVGEAYLGVGEYEKGIAEIEQVVSPSEEDQSAPLLAILGYAYGIAGRTPAAEEIFRRMEDLSRGGYVAAYDWAVLHAGSGEPDAVLQRLERAVDAGEPRVIWLKVEPVFDRVRNDVRFRRLIDRLQLD
jgi:tetratricopeptide (TPR) repeat protein